MGRGTKVYMNVNFIEVKNNCSIAVIDNFYNNFEVEKIKEELYSLYEISKLGIFSNIYSSKTNDNKSKQKSNSLFLDDLFLENRNLSKILSINRKIFTDLELKNTLLEKNLFYNLIYESNKDNTLLNFYRETDLYKSHKDSTCFTALTFFNLKPFTGGDLLFSEYNIKIECLEGRVVIFPGFLIHAAEEVQSGIRVSMAQFINMV
jgi:hypothetical protein